MHVPYVWGGYSPAGFDCSGFVSYVINHCGNGWNLGRRTAEELRNSCTAVPPGEAKPGDLIFFQGTYDTPGASHVGIYVGDQLVQTALKRVEEYLEQRDQTMEKAEKKAPKQDKQRIPKKRGEMSL